MQKIKIKYKHKSDGNQIIRFVHLSVYLIRIALHRNHYDITSETTTLISTLCHYMDLRYYSIREQGLRTK